MYETCYGKSYNRHLSHIGLKVAGKAALVAAGVAFGFHKGLSGDVSVPVPCSPREAPADKMNAVPDDLAGRGETRQDTAPAGPLSRLAAMESRLQRLEERATPQDVTRRHVTPQDLADAIGKATERISNDIDQRFEVQRLSVQSLRALVAQTDELLEKVLLRLEDTAE